MSENQEQQKQQKLSSTLWKHGFLIVILCLLVKSIYVLVGNLRASYSGEKYVNMVIVLMLLLNHIAFSYATSGWWSKIIKVIAYTWVIIGGIYVFTR